MGGRLQRALRADSHCYRADTSTTLQSNYPPIKNLNREREKKKARQPAEGLSRRAPRSGPSLVATTRGRSQLAGRGAPGSRLPAPGWSPKTQGASRGAQAGCCPLPQGALLTEALLL